jgi:dihydrofolate reductase
MDTRISIIVAIAKNRVIGLSSDKPRGLLWNIPEDLQRFKALTAGQTVVMGRKTLESIGHPLRGRENIVLSRQPESSFPGCIATRSLSEAIATASRQEIFVIGGAEVFREALPLTRRMFITEIDAEYEGDILFPEYNPEEWTLIRKEPGPGFVFKTFKRNSTASFVNLRNGRHEDQVEAMRRIAERKECPFCAENLRKEHQRPILLESDHWIFTENQWPYEHTRRHYLAIPKRHIDLLSEMTETEWSDFWKNAGPIIAGMAGGGLCLRFGSTDLTGATVRHLHIHLIEPDGKGKVEFKVGQKIEPNA